MVSDECQLFAGITLAKHLTTVLLETADQGKGKAKHGVASIGSIGERDWQDT